MTAHLPDLLVVIRFAHQLLLLPETARANLSVLLRSSVRQCVSRAHGISATKALAERSIAPSGALAAPSLAARLRRRVDAVDARVHAASERPGAIWCYWGDPVYTAGKGTMIDDLIQRAGGRNVARAAPGSWPQASVESVLSWAPEVIVTSYLPDGPESLADELLRLHTMAGWKVLPAVLSGRVHYLDADVMSRPGPRSVDALEMLVSVFHPEAEESEQK